MSRGGHLVNRSSAILSNILDKNTQFLSSMFDKTTPFKMPTNMTKPPRSRATMRKM